MSHSVQMRRSDRLQGHSDPLRNTPIQTSTMPNSMPRTVGFAVDDTNPELAVKMLLRRIGELERDRRRLERELAEEHRLRREGVKRANSVV